MPKSLSNLYTYGGRRRLFQADHQAGPKTICDLDAAAQCNRRAAPGARHYLIGGGCADSLSPHDGPPDAVGARQRPRRHRHQNVVERELAKEGVTRHDLGRDKFIERVWEWKAIYHARITEQQRRMGISCDWERERFTMDEGLSRAVREAFVRLYEEGLIYRGAYLVNWCPRCATAISDLEVEHEDDDSHLWYVRYWTEDKSRSITVATTDPRRSWAIPLWPSTPMMSAIATWWG
jgi:hypothetical protein